MVLRLETQKKADGEGKQRRIRERRMRNWAVEGNRGGRLRRTHAKWTWTDRSQLSQPLRGQNCWYLQRSAQLRTSLLRRETAVISAEIFW